MPKRGWTRTKLRFGIAAILGLFGGAMLFATEAQGRADARRRPQRH